MYKNFEEFWADKRIKKLAINKWYCMKARCYSPACKDYKYYGANGITICEEWLNDPIKFYKWLYKNKYYSSKEKESLDRIDSSKGYSPENCRLVSKEFNTRYIKGILRNKCNYSNTNLYYKAGKKITFETIKSRNRAGWNEEDIVNRKVEYHKVTIAVLKQALNCLWNKNSFVEHLIRFRNDNKGDYNLYRQAYHIIAEYKNNNDLCQKKSKTDYLVKRSVAND